MSLRAFNAVLSTAWAILPESLQLILEITTRENLPDWEAVEAKRAKYLASADNARIRDGVAILAVNGPIFRYANFFTEFSGGTTVTELARDFNAALDDPNVNAILLNIDSPGGEANGISEFAQMIFDARGKKPITAYVGGMGASAAYWIASAADEIVGDKTALLGSIGVVAGVPNPDAKSARDVQFVSSQSPKKRPNPNMESGRAQIQGMVDDLAQVFVETVARNRGVSADDVLANFGQGAVMVGQKAVDAGLADRLGSFEQTLSEMAAGKMPSKRKPKMAASAAKGEHDMTLIEKIKALVNGEEVAAEESATTNQSEIKAAEAKRVAAEKEAADLREKLAAEQREKLAAEADGFIKAQVQANKLLPAEAAAMTAAYAQAAADDAAMPLASGSRVETLRKGIEARPSHKLTQELVVGSRDHKVLKADENDQTGMSEERQRQLLGHTGLGQAALRAVK